MNILITWNESYDLNIKEIDQQHRKLIDMINVLYDSFVRKEHDNVLEQTISDLRDYAFVHFKEEEKYFEQVGYKDAPSHIAEHRFFMKSVEKFHKEYERNNLSLIFLIDFLRDWLTNHILNSDKNYVMCFFSHGIK